MKNLYLNLTTPLDGKTDTQDAPATPQYFFPYQG